MYIVDRLEGDWAVVEGEKQTFNLPRKLLPGEVREGDVIRITVEIDHEATRSRERKVKQLMEEVFED